MQTSATICSTANATPTSTAATTPRCYHRPADEAKRLHVCPRTIATWLSERRIPYRKCGKIILLDPVEVDEALARNFRVPALGEPRPPKRRMQRITQEQPA